MSSGYHRGALVNALLSACISSLKAEPTVVSALRYDSKDCYFTR